jgi:hypothetical protein
MAVFVCNGDDGWLVEGILMPEQSYQKDDHAYIKGHKQHDHPL